MPWYLPKALLIKTFYFERQRACLFLLQSTKFPIATNAEEWLGLNTPLPRGKVAELQVRR